ncbi:MAG: riboflavin synthase [Candidatus Loosdrechtia sp.]|uniref:riboflavin synthase n=1 Tax=Candidatus Loosdrechtia sp. TaxID=3101272 RepID=UPI003A79F742|nr:MAG: riboflavin synthase [Candidatus Jettenia sp. AMX2]
MFTGIIEHLASVKKLVVKDGGGELFLDVNGFYQDLKPGESIAINGACLTVKEIRGEIISFDISQETLRRTTLGALRHAENVNIERALRVGDRVGGHFVSGHVDGLALTKEKKQSAGQYTFSFSTEKQFTDMMIEKGSVTVDGISLTLVSVSDGVFSVALIPYTLASTTLGFKKAGDKVNIEIDMMGKWIKKLLINVQDKKTPLTREHLAEQGFL